MPNAAPSIKPTYLHLLDALCDGAMTITERVAAALKPPSDGTPPVLSLDRVTYKFLVLSGIVRRAIVVSQYLQTVPVPVEEREGRLMEALDRVFTVFAANKMTIAEYNAAMEAELDGERDHVLAEESDELDAFDELETIDDELDYDPDADVPGRPPAALAAELCRDFGIVVHKLPPEWLAPVPADLRLLCARAAAAALRPTS